MPTEEADLYYDAEANLKNALINYVVRCNEVGMGEDDLETRLVEIISDATNIRVSR